MLLSRRLKPVSLRVDVLETRRLLSLEPIGSEFQVNEFTLGEQVAPAVAMDADGDYVVVWQSYWETMPGERWELWGRRHDSDGQPLGGEFRVSDYHTGTQQYARVGSDVAGNFVVAWHGVGPTDGNGIYARRFDAAGNAMGSMFRVNSSAPPLGEQEYADVAVNASGEFVVAWQSHLQDGDDHGIYAQRYNAAGVPQGAEFRVNTITTNEQQHPSVAIDAEGNVVIAWYSFAPGATGIYAQRYDAQGVPQGGEFRVNTYTGNGQQITAEVAFDPNGDFVAGWTSYHQDGNYLGVFARKFDGETGAALTDEFRVNVVTTGSEHSPSIVFEPDADFIVAWVGGNQTSGYECYARRFRADGAPATGDLRVNTYTSGDQAHPKLATDGRGNFAAVWMSDGQDGDRFGVFGQRLAVVPPAVTASTFHYATAPHALRFTFDGELAASTFDPADLVLRNLTTGQTIPAGDVAVSFDKTSNVATFTHRGGGGVLPDGNYRATLLAAGVEDEHGDPLPDDVVFDFFFLMGDANRDARVNLDDFNVLAANFGQAPRDFTQGDFNYDGTVNLEDFNVLAGRFGQVVVPAGVSGDAFDPSRTRDADKRRVAEELLA